MVEPSARQITLILQRWTQGDDHALDSLTPLVYRDLRRIASYILKGERPNHTLQPTALVNETYLKLAGAAKQRWQDRTHFFAVAARAMRQVLVDYARRHRREKRGGKAQILQLDEALVFAAERSPTRPASTVCTPAECSRSCAPHWIVRSCVAIKVRTSSTRYWSARRVSLTDFVWM